MYNIIYKGEVLSGKLTNNTKEVCINIYILLILYMFLYVCILYKCFLQCLPIIFLHGSKLYHIYLYNYYIF